MTLWLTALAPLALVVPSVRHLLEASMYTHMLVEFPLLFLAGGSLRRLMPLHIRAAIATVDANGLLAVTVTTCAGALWMIPAALDLSLVAASVAAAKYTSLWLAGLLLGLGWPRMQPEVRIFFVGNTAWMLATAGLLVLESESQLCVNYLIDDQALTGAGLIGAAVMVICAPLLAQSVASVPAFPDQIGRLHPPVQTH